MATTSSATAADTRSPPAPTLQDEAGAELLALVQRIEALAPSLSEEDLRAAARRVGNLVAPPRAQAATQASESPLVPEKLSYSGVGGVLMLGDNLAHDDERCEECSDVARNAVPAPGSTPASGHADRPARGPIATPPFR